MTSTLVSKSTGCHKCGQRGHWARDCTNASSTGIELNGTEERHAEELGNNGQEMYVTLYYIYFLRGLGEDPHAAGLPR